MAKQLIAIIALLFSTMFLLMGNGLHGLLLPLAGTMAGFSTIELGLIGTGWATGFVLGCLFVPAIVRRAGHTRAFSCAAAGAAIIILLNGIFVDPIAWIVLRIASGFCISGAFMIIESWLNERVTNETRGTIFSVYMSITYFSITTGQFGVALGDPSTTTLFMAGAILFCFAVMPTALSKAAAPKPLERVRIDFRKLITNSPIALLAVLLVGVSNGAVGALAAVWGTEIGLATTTIALMMGLMVVSGALTQVPMGRISDKTDRRYVIAGAALFAALAGLTIFLLDPVNPPMVLAIMALYGGFAYPIYGLAVAHANDYATPGDFIAVSGGLLLCYGVGTMFGPLAASAAMNVLGPPALFTVTASAHLIVAGYAVYRTTRRAPIPESVREAFQGVPSSRGITPQTAALDPRSEDMTIMNVAPADVDPEPDGDRA